MSGNDGAPPEAGQTIHPQTIPTGSTLSPQATPFVFPHTPPSDVNHLQNDGHYQNQNPPNFVPFGSIQGTLAGAGQTYEQGVIGHEEHYQGQYNQGQHNRGQGRGFQDARRGAGPQNRERGRGRGFQNQPQRLPQIRPGEFLPRDRPAVIPFDYGRQYKKSDNVWAEGLIISTVYHHPDFQVNKIPYENQFRTLTNIGNWVYSKVRKMVVIQLYEYHCIALPIYSNRRAGITQKSNKHEFVGIRDTVSSELEKEATESPHPNIIVKREPYQDATGLYEYEVITPDSYVLFTSPIVFKYEYTCKTEGRLESADDLERLTKLFCRECKCPDCVRPAETAENTGDSPTSSVSEVLSRATKEAESRAAEERNESRLSNSANVSPSSTERSSSRGVPDVIVTSPTS